MEKPSEVPDNLKARLKNSYDAIAQKYTAWATKTSDIRVSYLERLRRRDCHNGKVLAHDPASRITANDLSSSQIALGKASLHEMTNSGDRVSWLEEDMMDLDLPAGSFDVVLGFYTIQHLPRQEQTVLLMRVAEWLRPGGYMLMNLPAEENEHVVMNGWMGPEGSVYDIGWGVARYRELVKEIGLELVLGEAQADSVRAEFLWVMARKPGVRCGRK